MKKTIGFIFKNYLVWMLTLIGISFLATKFVPLQTNFLGGGLKSYLQMPQLWSLANFDGEHYLSIAQNGYQPLTHFFFPVYVILIRFITDFFSSGLISYLLSGIFISHISFLIALYGLYKLVKLDFSEVTARNTLVLLLFFPTSFFFSAVYTESLFLCLAVWTFYFARKENFLLAGILTALSTATRIIGLALVPVLIFEYLLSKKNFKTFKNSLGLFISPMGIVFYMIYLEITTGDYLAFFNTVGIFGEQRGATLIAFPQVFYRYIFKVLPNLNYSNLLTVFTPLLEFVVSSLFLGLIVLMYKKLRRSYFVYSLIGFILPTLSGSFSSMPRYMLILFPGFILGALYFEKWGVAKKILFLSILLGLLIISFSLFTRGYWIS